MSPVIRRSPAWLFVPTICAGSFLLFLVEPLVARIAMPRLGGAAAVWNSAMLVYQSLLLAGYFYAHRLSRVSPPVQRWVHGGVLLAAAAWLPIGIVARTLPAGAQPALWVPWLFGLSIGPLFFAVAAQAPLLQRWYAIACPGRDPYPLYAASNLGSFAGLIAYPLLAEPLMGIGRQRWVWSAGYLLLVALTIACAASLPRAAAAGARAPAPPPSPAPSWRTATRWVALAFVPSGLMLATSTHVTTDVVAMPLLWVLPLGTYLLSFSVAFARRRWLADRVTGAAPLVLLLMGGVMMGGYQPRALFGLAVALLVLFAASVALHTALYRDRPAADRLTGFYLAIAAGGALGGVFCALLAPVLFDWTWEYPLLVLAAGAAVPLAWPTDAWRRLWAPRRRRAALLAATALVLAAVLVLRMRGAAGFGEAEQGNAYLVVAVLGVLALGERAGFVLVLAGALLIFGGWRSALTSLQPGARARSYFGVYAIRDDRGSRELASGTTTHGVELTGTPARERMPTTYYVPGSGVGQAMTALGPLYGLGARVGVVGLGSGTLACYAERGQRWSFFEIDPVVVRIARTRFRFLADCAPDARIVTGDARLALAHEPRAAFDLLALDAFASDAIPVHLMTREAFAGYARVLSPRGLLLVHVSNRFVDLEPVVAAAARAGGWGALVLRYVPSPDEEQASLSEWIALSRSPAVLATLAARDAEWRPLALRPGFVPWTDDRATVLPLVKRLD